MRYRDGDAARQSGAAAVEMALLTPLLALLVFGILVFGEAFTQDMALGNGAREGARAGATSGGLSCDDIIELTRERSGSAFQVPEDLGEIDVVVTIGGASACSGGPIVGDDPGSEAPCEGSPGATVRVAATYQRGNGAIPFGPTVDQVGGTGAFRCEYS